MIGGGVCVGRLCECKLSWCGELGTGCGRFDLEFGDIHDLRSLGSDLSRYQHETNSQSFLQPIQVTNKILALCVSNRSNHSRRVVSQRQLNNPCYQHQLHSRQNDRKYAYLHPHTNPAFQIRDPCSPFVSNVTTVNVQTRI
jgi:hypothetical protein